MRTALLVVLLVTMAVAFIGCDMAPETEETVEGVAEGGEKLTKTLAPFLPPPFNLIAMVVGATCTGVAAWIAKRKANRATTAELKAQAERLVKERLDRAIVNSQDAWGAMRADPKTKQKIDAALKAFGEWKQANPWASKSIGILDALRKGLVTLDQLTAQAMVEVKNGNNRGPLTAVTP